MLDDLLNFGTAIGMVEKEDPWNEVRDSSSSKVLGDKAQSLEMVGCQKTADILLDLRRKSIHGEVYCETRLCKREVAAGSGDLLRWSLETILFLLVFVISSEVDQFVVVKKHEDFKEARRYVANK